MNWFTAEIEESGRVQLYTPGIETVLFAGSIHSFVGTSRWTVPPNVQSMKSWASVRLWTPPLTMPVP